MSLADVRWIEIPHLVEPRGVRSVVEGDLDILFEIKCVVKKHGTPIGIERGGYAHRETHLALGSLFLGVSRSSAPSVFIRISSLGQHSTRRNSHRRYVNWSWTGQGNHRRTSTGEDGGQEP